MANKNKIAVTILNQEHYLISTDETGYVEKVAKLVDDRMQTILKSNSSLSHAKIAVLTALNLADDLSKARKKIEELKLVSKPATEEFSETKEQISSLTKHVSDTESLYDNLLNELDTIKNARKTQEDQLRALADNLRKMCGEVENSDEALTKSTLRIQELEEQLLQRESEIAEYIRVFDEIEQENLNNQYEDDQEEIIYQGDINE